MLQLVLIESSLETLLSYIPEMNGLTRNKIPYIADKPLILIDQPEFKKTLFE